MTVPVPGACGYS